MPRSAAADDLSLVLTFDSSLCEPGQAATRDNPDADGSPPRSSTPGSSLATVTLRLPCQHHLLVLVLLLERIQAVEPNPNRQLLQTDDAKGCLQLEQLQARFRRLFVRC